MRKILATNALAVLFICSSANAGGFITPNTTVAGDVQSTANGGLRFAYAETKNSYCCDFLPIATSVTVDSVSTTVLTGAGNLTAIDRTGTTPALASAGSSVTGNRLCFIPAVTGTITFTVTSISTSPSNIDVQCNETTLFGGYNTNANPYNFLEISNLTNSSISGRIYATNFDGTVVINGSSFTVGAGRRNDISIHDAAGPNVFGVLKIVHDGPLGALQANTSFYSGSVSALELKGTVAAKVRDRR